MSAKLNRDGILREILGTLVRGWGYKAVVNALSEISEKSVASATSVRRSSSIAGERPKAKELAQQLPIDKDRKQLILMLASDFDSGTAFPRKSDVRAFLASHHKAPRELRSRNEAFRRMLPILQTMSEKGLIALMSRSQNSGPAKLGSISNAIKGAGENLRGGGSDSDDQ